MVGAVGDDDFGTFLRARLAASGVDHAHVATIAGAGSGMSVALIDPAGDYAATIVSGANLLIAPAGLQDSSVWQDVGLLVLQNEVPEAVNIAAADAARERGIRTLLNAAPARPTSPEFFGLVDILVVNAVEAEMMGTPPIVSLAAAAEAAKALAKRFDIVVVTAGALGLAARSREDAFVLVAEKVIVVSSHGAGDAFIGALAANLAKGAGFRTACAAASHAAAEHVAGKPFPNTEGV